MKPKKSSEIEISKTILWALYRNRVLTAKNENDNENSDD